MVSNCLVSLLCPAVSTPWARKFGKRRESAGYAINCDMAVCLVKMVLPFFVTRLPNLLPEELAL